MPSAKRPRQDEQTAKLRKRIAQLEAQLAESRAQMVNLQNASAFMGQHLVGMRLGLGIGIFSADWSRASFVGPGMASVFGRTIAEIQADPACWMRAVESEDLPRVREAVATVDGHVSDVTYRIRRDGEVRWIRSRFSREPGQRDNGSLVFLFADITEQKLREETLRASEEQFRLLAEHSTDIISKHDLTGVFTYLSPVCRTLLGYEPAELLGKDGFEIVHPEDRAIIRSALDTISETVDTSALTCRIRHKDGRYLWFETLWKPIQLPPARNGGAGIEVIAVSRDITARRQAAERLKASEARLRAIFDTASDGIVTTDVSGMIEQFNPGAEQLFGYRQDEVLGQSVAILMTPEDAARYKHWTRRPDAFRLSVAGTREVVGRRKDGSLCEFEIRVGETSIGGHSIFTAILRDVSERKITERRLRESEKLAATGRIAARVAHEINNPLAGIKNSFLLVKDAIPSDDKYFPYVARIESEIDRIARIVRQMFDLYTPAHSALAPIGLSQQIHNVVALLESIASAHEVALEVDAALTDARVELPADSIRQVLYNLIVNAIEASPRGGVVRVTGRVSEGAVDVFVSDRGPGIPPDLQTQIYEPFFTTKARSGTGGLGLGLSISCGIVEAMQGTLDFQSEPGRGTVFHFHLPALKHDPESSHATDAETSVR